MPPFLQAAAWPRKLFLWASEGNVRDPRAPPPNPSRQLAGLPPFLQAAAWPRKLFLWASEGNVRDPRAPPPNPSRQLAGLPPFLQAAAWPRKLFLWASEGSVRDPRAPPPNPSQQLAGLPLLVACPRQRKPQHATLSSHPRLQSPTASASLLHWPNKGRSLAQKAFSMPQLGPESFFYGLPKATLETHGPRPQTLLGSWQACLRSCRPQLGPESFFYGLPKATLETHGPRPQTPLGSWQACLRSCRPQLGPASFFYGLPKATLETHGPRPKPLSAAGRPASVPAGRSLAQKAFSMGFRRQR